MGYNKENYRRIRTAYQTKYLAAVAEAERRTAELHMRSPELREIDRRLAKTGAAVALAAIGTGEAYREKLEGAKKENEALLSRREALLAEMGLPADYTMPPYECKRCRDSGFEGTKMCSCMRRELTLAAFQGSGMAELLERQNFDNFSLQYYTGNPEIFKHMRFNLEFMKQYAEGFSLKSENLLLFGGTGLGKTHLSSAVAGRVIERGFDVYYAAAPRMFDDFEAQRFGRLSGDIDPTRYTECELLILDDLGTEVSTQYTISCLYNVINTRLNHRLPTVISTNLSAAEIQKRYTDRIVSRLFGEYRSITFSGTDIRLQKIRKDK